MSKFYCPAPWHAGYFTHDYQSVCCVHPGVSTDSPLKYIKSQEIFNIKQGISTGNLTPDCQACKDAEDAGYFNVSRSHVEMARSLNLEFVDDPNVDTVPREIEIRFSNLCNFKCRMCGPNWSSMIATEVGENPEIERWYGVNPQGASRPKIDCTPKFLEDAKEILKNLRWIYITGGEPMIQKNVMEFIDYMIENGFNDSDLMLQITTNASAINPEILYRLGQFRQITLILSIDGVGPIAEYQRHGTIWPKLDRNVHAIGEFGLSSPNYMCMGIHTALSAYTVLGADQLMSYCLDLIDRYQIESWNISRVRNWFGPNVLSGELRNRAISAVGRALEILESSKVKTGKRESIPESQTTIFYSQRRFRKHRGTIF